MFRVVIMTLAVVFNPSVVAVVLLISAVSMSSIGVYILFGLGWALICAAAQMMFAAIALLRGIVNG